jgi:hypothetical protein
MYLMLDCDDRGGGKNFKRKRVAVNVNVKWNLSGSKSRQRIPMRRQNFVRLK